MVLVCAVLLALCQGTLAIPVGYSTVEDVTNDLKHFYAENKEIREANEDLRRTVECNVGKNGRFAGLGVGEGRRAGAQPAFAVLDESGGHSTTTLLSIDIMRRIPQRRGAPRSDAVCCSQWIGH